MEEIKGDLFSVLDGEDLQGAALCHCVSSDFEMGKGIAVTFKNMLSKEKVAELRLLHPKVGTGVTVIHHTVVFFNLVTKANYYGKPTLTTMRDSLLWMRNECEKMQVRYFFSSELTENSTFVGNKCNFLVTLFFFLL
jgi:hypothetical protein